MKIISKTKPRLARESKKMKASPKEQQKMAGKNEMFTVEKVMAALYKGGGFKSQAAKILKCSARTVDNYFERHPELFEIRDEIRDTVTDMAESQLFKAIKDGNLTATIFYLKCRAKNRGYVERTELAGVSDQPINITMVPAGLHKDEKGKGM